MGLFTTRQLLGYTEQKVKFRALFLELFFRRTVNFHTERARLPRSAAFREHAFRNGRNPGKTSKCIDKTYPHVKMDLYDDL